MKERRHERNPFEGGDRRSADRRKADRRKTDRLGGAIKYLLVAVVVAALVQWFNL